MSTMRWLCKTCGVISTVEGMLSAPNPFIEDDMIYGCPKCRAIESFVGACDVQECPRKGTIGTPTPSGYMRTCAEHAP